MLIKMCIHIRIVSEIVPNILFIYLFIYKLEM